MSAISRYILSGEPEVFFGALAEAGAFCFVLFGVDDAVPVHQF